MKKILMITVIVGIIGTIVGYFTHAALKKHEAGEMQIILSSFSGEVTILRKDLPYNDLRIGMNVLPSDIIITGSESYAVLKIHDFVSGREGTLRIDPISQSTVGERVEDIYQVGLDDGHMYGDVDLPVRVTTKENTYAETKKGSFGISTDTAGKRWE